MNVIDQSVSQSVSQSLSQSVNQKPLNFAYSSLLYFSCRKEIPLLELISRGTNLSTQEASAITPLLSLFSSLLSSTLFSVHDNEFYGVEGKTKNNGNIFRVLEDVTLII